MPNSWKLYKERRQNGIERFIIRRWDGKKHIRLPVSAYQLIRNNEEELKKLVIRLNEQLPPPGEKIRRLIEIKHAFISPDLLEEYRQRLLVQIASKERAKSEYYYLITYFLNFFINQKKMPNPLEWHVCHKTDWAEFLLSPQVPKSMSSKKWIVNAANRFMVFLHEKRPTEVPPLKFQPLTRARYKELEARRNLEGDVRVRKLIPDADIELIRKCIPDQLRPFFELAYNYGLRRSESLAVESTDLRKGYLNVERQLVQFSGTKGDFAPLKGREIRRKIPHWTCKPEETIKWILSGVAFRMHPDTLSDRWLEFMKANDLDYDFHDLRHTWITKVIRLHNPRDVQLAAGHKDLRTTMQYLHDDRSMDDEVFKAS